MSIAHDRKKLTAAALGAAVAAAAASGIAIPLAATILASPASADAHHGGFAPPDPCTKATSCPNVHMGVALNPQPLPPGRRLNPQPLPPGLI
jgi:hypothetical protein